MSELRTIVPLSEKAISVLDDIEKKYHLEETDEEFLNIIEKEKPPKIAMVQYVAENFATSVISEQELIDILKKLLHFNEKEAQKLGKEIEERLVPLMKTFTMEDLKNYRSTQEPTEVQNEAQQETTASILLEKINKNNPAPENIPQEESVAPRVKKVEVKNVEENAEHLEKERSKTTERGTAGDAIQRKGQSDRYRESI